VVMGLRNVIMGSWNVNGLPSSVNRVQINVIMRPWNVNRGQWNVIRGPVM
jgi:hypothetical protein